jgi:hypothetical protein
MNRQAHTEQRCRGIAAALLAGGNVLCFVKSYENSDNIRKLVDELTKGRSRGNLDIRALDPNEYSGRGITYIEIG